MKRALVISGGGSKGAFSVGVIKELIEGYHLDFNIFVGTSTGALIAPLAALKEIKKLEEFYTTATNDKIIKKYNFGDRVLNGDISIFTFGPLKEIIKTIYTDDFFNRLMNSGKEVYLTTVCLQTEELVVFTTSRNPPLSMYYKMRTFVNADQFRAAVLASASQPVFTPPVKVDENVPGVTNKNYQYCDGGVREYAGIAMAVDAGASEIFTILHGAKKVIPPNDNLQFKQIFPILQQTISMFITDVGDNDIYIPYQYNEALKYIRAVKDNMRKAGVPEANITKYFSVTGNNAFRAQEPLKLHMIQPEKPLGGGPGGLDFNPVEMREMLAGGRLAMQAYVANLQPGDVDWA